MKTKLHKNEVSPLEKYWYIYQGGGKCQLVHVIIDEGDKEFDGMFNVQISENGDWFNSFPLRVDTDKDGYIEDLFLFEDKDDAEIMWCHYFIKKFMDNTCVDYSEFIRLTKVLHEKHPELLLKGL